LANTRDSAETNRTIPTHTRKQRQVRLSDAQSRALVADYVAGASITAVAAKYRVDHETAKRRLLLARVHIRLPSAVISSSDVPRIRELRTSGWTYDQLGQQYGCSDNTIRSTLRRYGLA
jgi:hypothetical protein